MGFWKSFLAAAGREIGRSDGPVPVGNATGARLQRDLAIVQTWQPPVINNGPVLAAGEHIVAAVYPAGLVEVRRGPSTYVTDSAGFSVRVTKGVRVGRGRSLGHVVPGPEAPTQVDGGTGYVTTQRILFAGSRQSREWRLDRLIDRRLVGYGNLTWIELPVSSRQRTSGLSVPPQDIEDLDVLIDLAVALRDGTRDQLATAIQAEIIGAGG